MATLAVSSGDFMRPHRGPVRIFHAPEAASQTFKKGTPLIANTVGGKENQVKAAGVDPTAGILGVAADDASGVEGTDISIWAAEPGVEFVARVQDTGALVSTFRGTAYGIIADATRNIMRVDLTETTNTNLIGVSNVDAVGDVNGRVSFQWKASARTPFQG